MTTQDEIDFFWRAHQAYEELSYNNQAAVTDYHWSFFAFWPSVDDIIEVFWSRLTDNLPLDASKKQILEVFELKAEETKDNYQKKWFDIEKPEIISKEAHGEDIEEY